MTKRNLLARLPIPDRIESALDDALDKGLSVQRPAVQKYVAHLRAKNPNMTPKELVAQLERHYRATVIGIGGASGAAAALPGVGTVASVATGAAEITGFISATAMFVLALAEIYSVPVSDPEVRRTLVIAVLVGEGAETVIAGTASDSGHWAQMIGAAATKDEGKLSGINGRLTTMMMTRFGAKQGALLFGRALPLGVGAGIGAAGNAALARGVISTSRRAFGPAPKKFPGRVIDVTPLRRRPRPDKR